MVSIHSIKDFVLTIVLERVVLITMTALAQGNAVVTESAQRSVLNNASRILDANWGSIVVRRRVFGFGRIVVLILVLTRIATPTLTVTLLMNVAFIENALRVLVSSVPLTPIALQVIVARTNVLIVLAMTVR